MIATLLVSDVKRRLFGENLPRIRKCLEQLDVTEIWYRPNEQSNSVGNLILHLCGNARQWIIAGLGQQADVRERQTEFDEHGPISATELLARLAALEKDIVKVLDTLTSDDLTKQYVVQGFEENGVSILVHVTEHFSYHVGQITYYVKAIKNMDMNYYAGIDLDKKSNLR